jgi:trans-aconitate methyltransferase
MSKSLEISGAKRIVSWEKGWGENLNNLKNHQEDALIPKYFGKYPYVRFKQEFYGAGKNTELIFLRALLLNEIENILTDFLPKNIIEFGCGTGHNLFFLHSKLPKLILIGSDWTSGSAQIIEKAKKTYSVSNIYPGRVFDYFNPDYRFELGSEDLVITVASLEQVGNKHRKFIDYLIKKKPKRILHIEPEPVLLDANNRFDKTSIDYMEKRGYLCDFLLELKSREALGQIRIIKYQRSYFGSFPMDGYSIFVWEPIHGF